MAGNDERAALGDHPPAEWMAKYKVTECHLEMASAFVYGAADKGRDQVAVLALAAMLAEGAEEARAPLEARVAELAATVAEFEEMLLRVRSSKDAIIDKAGADLDRWREALFRRWPRCGHMADWIGGAKKSCNALATYRVDTERFVSNTEHPDALCDEHARNGKYLVHELPDANLIRDHVRITGGGH